MKNQISIQVWAENLKTKTSWKVAQNNAELNLCSKRAISQFLVKYLTEQSGKQPLTVHNLQDKIEELAIIEEVNNEDSLEAEFAGVKYFIRYANFEF